MKKRILALFMVLVAVVSIVAMKQDTSGVAKAATKTYYIDVEGKWTSSVKITIKGKKMSIKGKKIKKYTSKSSKKTKLKKISNLKISSKCKFYQQEENEVKISYKEAKKYLKSGSFGTVTMKIKNKTVYMISFCS